MKHFYLILFSISLIHTCTIGGAYDDMGRPFIFKIRDSEYSNNKMHYNSSGSINYIGNINVGTPNLNQTWMGVNEEGLAIINTIVHLDYLDDEALSDNGKLMHDILSECTSLEEFRDIKNDLIANYDNLYGNFLLLDNEPSNTESSKIWLYEIIQTNGQNEINAITEIGLNDYICRSNFIYDENQQNSGDNFEDSKAIYRYDACELLLSSLNNSTNLNTKTLANNITRNFKKSNLNDYQIPYLGQVGSTHSYGTNEGRPYGYISTLYSISRNDNVSASIIRGTIDNENPKLTTMWVSMGNPASTIFTPVFPISVL